MEREERFEGSEILVDGMLRYMNTLGINNDEMQTRLDISKSSLYRYLKKQVEVPISVANTFIMLLLRPVRAEKKLVRPIYKTIKTTLKKNKLWK